MIDLIPVLLSGLVAGGVIGFLIANNRAGDSIGDQDKLLDDNNEEEGVRLEDVAKKIQSLTLTVAADVNAHQTRMEGITNNLECSGGQMSAAAIVDTVAELVAANRQMQQRLEDSQLKFQEQSSLLQSTRQLANCDALTGLANRRYLDEKLAALAQNPSTDEQLIAMVDIDHFKSINDVFGHQAGDLVLNRFGELLSKRLRSHATCIRYGGEEFAVISRLKSWREFATEIDNVRKEMESMRMLAADSDRVVTFSGGIAQRSAEESPVQWLERADKALYEAKHGGRNAVYVYLDRISRFSEKVSQRNKIAAPAPPAGSSSGDEGALASDSQPAKVAGVDGRQCLVSQFRTMAANVNSDQVQLAAVAVRLPSMTLNEEQRRDILDCSRRLLRSVDKVGFDDPRTLLSLMVTSGAAKAEERAEQLLEQVNQTLRELTDDGPISVASVGVSLMLDDLTAEDVISQATERADQAIIA
ncbi:GGDEF domain-containing protein [Planctomycetaceae bacterium SH139]